MDFDKIKQAQDKNTEQQNKKDAEKLDQKSCEEFLFSVIKMFPNTDDLLSQTIADAINAIPKNTIPDEHRKKYLNTSLQITLDSIDDKDKQTNGFTTKFYRYILNGNILTKICNITEIKIEISSKVYSSIPINYEKSIELTTEQVEKFTYALKKLTYGSFLDWTKKDKCQESFFFLLSEYSNASSTPLQKLYEDSKIIYIETNVYYYKQFGRQISFTIYFEGNKDGAKNVCDAELEKINARLEYSAVFDDIIADVCKSISNLDINQDLENLLCYHFEHADTWEKNSDIRLVFMISLIEDNGFIVKFEKPYIKIYLSPIQLGCSTNSNKYYASDIGKTISSDISHDIQLSDTFWNYYDKYSFDLFSLKYHVNRYHDLSTNDLLSYSYEKQFIEAFENLVKNAGLKVKNCEYIEFEDDNRTYIMVEVKNPFKEENS